MNAVEVPQATLPRIRAVVEACAAGPVSRDVIEKKTGFSRRHVDYAVSAAHMLRLLDVGHKVNVDATALGRQLAGTRSGSEEERVLFHDAITNSIEIQKIVPNLLSTPGPDVDELARRIARISKLAISTAEHRARMMLKWRSVLVTPQLRLFRDARPSGMWRRIEISNFRSIVSASINLAPFTVIVGPNGSGKSNFADALVFARDVALDASAAVSSRGGIVGVRRWRPTKPTDVAIDLRAANTRPALDRAYTRHLFKIHSGRQGDWNFSKEIVEVVESGSAKVHLDRKGSAITGSFALPVAPATTASAMLAAKQFKQFASTAALRNVRRYRLNPDAMRQPQLSVEETRLRESGDNIAAAIHSIRSAEKIDAIIQPMAKIVPGLKDIYVDQVGRYLALKFKQTQEEDEIAEFNATEMSEGALRALGIIVATHQMASDELLIIEEPEVSIHVGAATLLFDLLKGASARGAVLVTTHSADLLDAARDEEILVCEYKFGSTRIGPLSSAQRKVVRDGLFSVAELMRSEPLRIEQRTGGERSRRAERDRRGKK